MSTVWALEVARADGRVACVVPFRADWSAAAAWVRFEGIRRGLLPPVLLDGDAAIEPVWDAECGAPYVAAARITLRAESGSVAIAEQVPVACLAESVRDELRVLVRDGVLVDGEMVLPRVRATVDSGGARDEDGARGPGLEPLPVELPLRDTPLAPLLARATAWDAQLADGDVPVLLPAVILDEIAAAVRVTPGLESGGFLLGHLHRDASASECFVEVTARIPARHVVAERFKLTFTPETWAAADAEADARGRGERIVGWDHFHPWWCGSCPADRRPGCTLDPSAFSSDDVRLHGLFGLPCATALLSYERPDGTIAHTLHGWRRGVVVPRGYHRLDDPARSATKEVVA